MTYGLLQYTMTGIDQNDAQVGCRSTCHHVAGVLNVAWSIGNDKLSLGCGEVAVCHVNGNALFALGPQTVGQQGEVHLLVAARFRGCLNSLQLIFKYRLRIVQQSSD